MVEKEKKGLPIILKLFLTFFKIGLFTFGGGYAMIALIEDDCIEKKKWITHEEMLDLTAIAESTPGPIAINCATFTGYRQGGILGSAAATFGVVLPSFTIIYLISLFFDNLLKYQIVTNALNGIRVAVGILIIQAAIKLFKKIKKDAFGITVFIVSTLVMLLTDLFSINFSSLWVVLIAAVCGLAFYLIGNLHKSKKGGEEQ